jgi:excisionase family DNA binding protein
MHVKNRQIESGSERPFDKIPRLPKQSRCPLEDRPPHTSKNPGSLTQPADENIERQIIDRGYNPLPVLGSAQRFFRADCFAVWPAGSRYERVPKDAVCGFYDHSLIWQPNPMKADRLKDLANVDASPLGLGSDVAVMDASEVCAYLHISRATLYRLIDRSKIPCFRMGYHYRFNREQIDEWRHKLEGR